MVCIVAVRPKAIIQKVCFLQQHGVSAKYFRRDLDFYIPIRLQFYNLSRKTNKQTKMYLGA